MLRRVSCRSACDGPWWLHRVRVLGRVRWRSVSTWYKSRYVPVICCSGARRRSAHNLRCVCAFKWGMQYAASSICVSPAWARSRNAVRIEFDISSTYRLFEVISVLLKILMLYNAVHDLPDIIGSWSLTSGSLRTCDAPNGATSQIRRWTKCEVNRKFQKFYDSRWCAKMRQIFIYMNNGYFIWIHSEFPFDDRKPYAWINMTECSIKWVMFSR